MTEKPTQISETKGMTPPVDFSRIVGANYNARAIAAKARAVQLAQIAQENERRDHEMKVLLLQNAERDLGLLKVALQNLFGYLPACELTWVYAEANPLSAMVDLGEIEGEFVLEATFGIYHPGGHIVSLRYNNVQVRDLAHLGELLEKEASR